jgi:hypothetical protein
MPIIHRSKKLEPAQMFTDRWTKCVCVCVCVCVMCVLVVMVEIEYYATVKRN